MPGATEQSPEHDPAALFREWLASFAPLGEGAPWESLRLLGAALLAARPVAAGVPGEMPGPGEVLGDLLRDFRSRLDLLIELPDLPSSLPAIGSFPMLGPAREWQLALEAIGRCWQAERAAAAALQRADWRVLSNGLSRLENALATSGAMPGTLVALHGLLVAHCEEAHQQALREDAYVAAFGAHANASLALRQALDALVQRGMPGLGLPRTSELQAMEARLSALEASVRGVSPDLAKAAPRRRTRRGAG